MVDLNPVHDWPEMLRRGVRGLLAHVVKHGVELLRQAVELTNVERSVEQSIASSQEPAVELPNVEPVAVVTPPAAAVRMPRGPRGPRGPRQLVRRPVDRQLYWRKPLPHDLTPTQAEVIRLLDRHETPLTR